MKYIVKPTSKFQKDLNRIKKRGYNIELLTEVIKALSEGIKLDSSYRDHALSGVFERLQGVSHNARLVAYI